MSSLTGVGFFTLSAGGLCVCAVVELGGGGE